MLGSFALAIAALAALTTPFIIPTDLADGTWLIELDEHGNAISAPMALDALGRRGPVFSRSLSRRQNPPPLPSPAVRCSPYRAKLESATDYSRVRSFFNGLCDKGEHFPRDVAIVIAEGGAMAYMCNYNGENRCWRQEFDEANALMDAGCGSGSVAAVQVDFWNKRYGRANRGDSICWGV